MFRKWCVMFVAVSIGAGAATYEANWESIDSRPNPAWFSEAKFGIFIHWGVYSVPAWGPKGKYAEWYWHDMQNKDGDTWKFHESTYGADVQYQDFAPLFKAEMYDPAHWADIFKRSGAKYVVLTSKHHEGFCLWPSQESWNWNSVDIGPHRDLAGELTEAVKAAGLKMGFYYSMYEWFNPLYRNDVHRYVDQHMLPQMKDLVLRYEPAIVWPDGEWEHPSETWRSTEFLAWLFNESPVKDDVVINDRWGKDCRSVHGGFFTTEYGHYGDVEGTQKDWEECRGIGASFGYNRNETIDDYNTPEQLIAILAETVAHGGNLLLDIGPTADGRIPVIMEQRLVQLGEWLEVNGEAIYGTKPWRVQKQDDTIFYTQKDGTVYAIVMGWPGETLTLRGVSATTATQATMIGVGGTLQTQIAGNGLTVSMPALSPAEAPCRYAYVVKLAGVE